MSIKIVKSASRIFEILELFDQTKKAMPPVEIATKLGYPLASTHELLKTMAELGYFTYGDPKWAYKPSPKLPMVVDWVRDLAIENRRLNQFMSDLNEVTKETINLSRQLPHAIEIVKGLECIHEIGVSSRPGTEMVVTKSLTGLVSLAALSDEELENYLLELKMIEPVQFTELDIRLLQNIRNEVQQTGVAMRSDLAVRGIGAICFPVKIPGSNQVYVLGVVGPSERISQNSTSHHKAVKALVKEHKILVHYKINLPRA